MNNVPKNNELLPAGNQVKRPLNTLNPDPLVAT